MKIRILVAIVFLTTCPEVVFGQVEVYDNLGGAAITDNIPADETGTLFGESADDVLFTNTTLVTGINWMGLYQPDILGGGDGAVAVADDDFKIRIYDDLTGAPGTINQEFSVGNSVNRIDTGMDVTLGMTNHDLFGYSADINFSFQGGLTYWVSILNNTNTDDDNFSQGAVSGGNAYSALGGGAFTVVSGPGAATDFRLTTSVPEPSSSSLLAVGLMMLAGRRRR